MDYILFATTAKGMEPLLANELKWLGAQKVSRTTAGVSFVGSLATAYRVCLWSRIANRVLLQLIRFKAGTPEELYWGVRSVNWLNHLRAENTLAVNFLTKDSFVRNSQYGAQIVKDAVVDQFREQTGDRPNVDRLQPDIRINLYLRGKRAILSIDLSGDSLHRRGYRLQGLTAPLKENLAAVMLISAEWYKFSLAGRPLCDPLCGSGTLPIEAALMAANIAPGLSRKNYGFLNWQGHNDKLWQELLTEAQQKKSEGLKRMPTIMAFDVDGNAIDAAISNAERAGLAGKIEFKKAPLGLPVMQNLVQKLTQDQTGLLVANPPYGERLGDERETSLLYKKLGQVLKGIFSGWQAAILTSKYQWMAYLDLEPRRSQVLYNGQIECKLYHFVIAKHYFPQSANSPGAQMFANRLKKNEKRLRRWRKKQGIYCWRIYDRDMPEYAVAVDIYQGEEKWIHVHEYQAPSTVDPDKAKTRLAEVMAVIPQTLEISPDRLFLKIHRPQKGKVQYSRLDKQGEFIPVFESDSRFWVNFKDFLNTGLFLDHRHTREMIRQKASGKNFLNLFAYTGSASVYAAKGGAKTTTTVDMSPTYINWARRNMRLNDFTNKNRHKYIEQDIFQWLAKTPSFFYDLIFLDAPTFSNSKKMNQTFDVQRDHPQLIGQVLKLLAPGGTIIFANNMAKFKINLSELPPNIEVEDISRQTIPEDFPGHRKVHQCFLIRSFATR